MEGLAGEQMQTCHSNNIDTIVAIPRRPTRTDQSKPVHLRKDNFIYNEKDNTYTCPSQNVLTKKARYQRKDKKGKPAQKFDRYSVDYTLCVQCQYLDQCVSKGNQSRKQGRYIDKYLTDQAVQRNKEHVNKNKELYKRRQAIVEHPFGTIKRQWGFNHTLMKTIPKVQTEFSIILLCYNLRRAMSILGINELKSALIKAFNAILDLSTAMDYHKQVNHYRVYNAL